MPPIATMSTPVALVDTLNALLEAEQTSIFRFMGEGYPYLNRATVDVRRPLQEMVNTIEMRARALADQIESLGGVPTFAPRGIDREEQYLAFLSLKFLLPKLVEGKKEMIERYENATKAVRGSDEGATEAKALLARLFDEHRVQLKTLEEAAARVASQK
jgi:hypothetical protein